MPCRRWGPRGDCSHRHRVAPLSVGNAGGRRPSGESRQNPGRRPIVRGGGHPREGSLGGSVFPGANRRHNTARAFRAHRRTVACSGFRHVIGQCRGWEGASWEDAAPSRVRGRRLERGQEATGASIVPAARPSVARTTAAPPRRLVARREGAGDRAARRPLWAGNRASDRGVPGSLASRVYSSPDSLTPFGSKKCEPGCPPDRRRLRSRADPPQGLGPRLPVRRGPLLLGPAQTTAGPPLRSGTTGRCVCGYRTAQAVARSSPRSSSAAKVATTFGSSASQIPTGSPGRPPITSMR